MTLKEQIAELVSWHSYDDEADSLSKEFVPEVFEKIVLAYFRDRVKELEDENEYGNSDILYELEKAIKHFTL